MRGELAIEASLRQQGWKPKALDLARKLRKSLENDAVHSHRLSAFDVHGPIIDEERFLRFDLQSLQASAVDGGIRLQQPEFT